MLLSNQHYFNISVQNEEVLEQEYMTLAKDRHLGKYVEQTKKVKELLCTIKTLEAREEDASRFYNDLYAVISNDYGSRSELACFLNACDCTLKTINNDIDTFKKVVSLYLANRDLTDIVPREWIQALIDKGASRSKGQIGEKKLVRIAESEGFVHVETWEDLLGTDKAVARFKKNVFDISSIKDKLGINLDFHTQNKMLDIILKSGKKYIFIEAKHLKEGGGSQDKQIKELIEIISETNENNDVYLGAFMDGMYSNVLLKGIDEELFAFPCKLLEEQKSDKLKKQRYDIVKGLHDNTHSFWLNTAGFKDFIKDF